jgi:hypothetical protein
MFGIPVEEIAWLAGAIVAGGLVTGMLAGMFGIGGGGIIVPVLYEVFRALGVADDVRMQLCVGTSIAIIVPTNVRSYLTHRARGAVLMDIVRAWAVPAVLGVATGSMVAAFAPGKVLTIAYVVVAIIIAGKLLASGDAWRLADDLPRGVGNRLYGFAPGRIPDGHQRRFRLQHDPHPARQVDSQCGRDLGRSRRADYHRGHDRLYVGGPATAIRDAGFFDWIRIVSWRRPDGAGVEPRRADRGAACSCDAQAKAGNCLWPVLARGITEISRKLDFLIR